MPIVRVSLQEVIFTIKDKAATPTLASQTFCELEAKTLADITLPSDKYTWYQTNDATDEVTNLDVLLGNGDTYWLGFENDANCKSELQEVVFTIKDKAATPTLTSQTFCELEAKELVDISLPSDKYTWYQTNDATDEVTNLSVLLGNGDMPTG